MTPVVFVFNHHHHPSIKSVSINGSDKGSICFMHIPVQDKGDMRVGGAKTVPRVLSDESQALSLEHLVKASAVIEVTLLRGFPIAEVVCQSKERHIGEL